ncbi:hypothetical protein BH11PSE9_BH11PSE9_05990 [soil metagenome]
MLMKVKAPASLSEIDPSHFVALAAGQADLISLAHPDGRLVYVNEAYARNFGCAAAELVGRNLYDFVEHGDQSRVRAVLGAVLRSRKTSHSENRIRSADGNEHWMVWTNSAHSDCQGTTLLHSVGRDVTERRQIAGSLESSEAFLERIGKVAGVGGWEVDIATGHVRWSEQTRRIHEVGSDFVPTLEAAISFYAEGARPAIESAVRNGMATGEPWDMELPLVTAAGRKIRVRAVGEVEFENGQAVRLVGAVQDITDRHRLQEQLADNARFLRRLADGLPIEVAYVGADRRYRFANEAFSRRVGADLADVVGKTHAELMSDTDRAGHAERERAVLGGEPQQFELEHLSNNMSRRFEHRFIPDRSDSGEVNGFFVASIDITDSAHDKREVKRQMDILRSVTEAIPATVVVVGTDGRYRFVNSAFEHYCGLPRALILGRRAAEVLDPAEVERRRPWMQRALAGEAVNFTLDYPQADATTSYMALSCVPLRTQQGGIEGFVGIGQDITAQKTKEARLTHLSQRDPLTGLLNRSGFEQGLKLLPTGHGGVAVLYIDLDDFKPVNDRHGHPTGDLLLQMFSQRLMALVRPSDVVARFGGDEFAIAMSGLPTEAIAGAVAEKVLHAASTAYELGPVSLKVRATVGMAFSNEPDPHWHDLLTCADERLLQCKAAGKGRWAGNRSRSSESAGRRAKGIGA